MVFVNRIERRTPVSYIAAGNKHRVSIGQKYVYTLTVWILIKDFIGETLCFCQFTLLTFQPPTQAVSGFPDIKAFYIHIWFPG